MSLSALNQLLADSHVEDLVEMLDMVLHVREDVSQAFAVSHRLRDSRPMQRTLRKLNADPEAEALIRSRALMPSLPLDDLLARPAGSLGNTFGRLIQALGYNPDFHPGPEYFNNLESDADYINYRTFATHDLHHVLTGFNFDASGELGVLGVSMAQYCAPGFTFIGLASLLASWLSSEVPYSMATQDSERIRNARYKFSLIQKGLDMGEAARPLFALDWPSLLDRDLEGLRQDLGVEPVREGLASWYARPELIAALA
jgi:ubiquinone biosynthesis protein COQ4